MGSLGFLLTIYVDFPILEHTMFKGRSVVVEESFKVILW
jgi:hypothetical protein